MYTHAFDLKLGFNKFLLENTTSLKKGSLILVDLISTGRIALNQNGDGLYSDFYLNNTELFRLNEYKNQRFYLNVLSNMLFYQRFFNFNHTFEYVGNQSLLANGVSRLTDIKNCKKKLIFFFQNIFLNFLFS